MKIYVGYWDTGEAFICVDSETEPEAAALKQMAKHGIELHSAGETLEGTVRLIIQSKEVIPCDTVREARELLERRVKKQ